MNKNKFVIDFDFTTVLPLHNHITGDITCEKFIT